MTSSEPRIVHGRTLAEGSDCTVRPGVMGVAPGAVSAGSYAGARGELVALLGRPEVARWVARALVTELQQRPRNGLAFPSFASSVLRCLQEAGASVALPQGIDVDPLVGSVGGVSRGEDWMPVSQAAAASGRSAVHVRRLVREGRVDGVRVGPGLWLVDVRSLKSVLAKAGYRGSAA